MTTTYANEDINLGREVLHMSCVCCNTRHRTFRHIFNNVGLCQICNFRDSVLKFSNYNSVDQDPIPDYLKNRSYIEEINMTQMHPVVSLYCIHDSQCGYRGNVISFEKHLELNLREPVSQSCRCDFNSISDNLYFIRMCCYRC